MTDRDKLAEILAKCSVDYWLHIPEECRAKICADMRAALYAAEAAGWLFVAPSDGR